MTLQLTRQRLIVACAAYLVIACNARFFIEAENAFPLAENGLFLVSLGAVLGAVNILLSLLFSGRNMLKPFLLALILIAASSSYFADQFGTIVDGTMLLNVVQTDAGEAADLLTAGFLIHLLLFGLIPAAVVLWLPVVHRSARQELAASLKLASGTVTLILVCVLFNGAQFASFLREFKAVRYYATPTYPIYSAFKLARASAASGKETSHEVIYPDAALPPDDPHRELMILIVGETARADHFSLYGYDRPTNTVMGGLQSLMVFRDVRSCGTTTAISVPCMFSQLPRSEFSLERAHAQDNLLDVLQRAGVSVLWRDNNSSSKGVADRVAYEDFRSPETNPVCDLECRDVGMLSGLQDYIDRQSGDILIVLHQMGSHGPAYFRRTPAERAVFQPVCQSKVFSECSEQEIVNAYDNSIRYTDWFLGEVVKLLQNNQDQFEAAMLYLSDHGESLGEYGVYLHGLPYAIAPAAQTHVPMILWLGDNNDVDEFALGKTLGQPMSHDTLWGSILTFFEVEFKDAEKPESIITMDSQ